jgi:hypothetical protein
LPAIEVAISVTVLGLPLEISIHRFLEGATHETGSVAIIDVFRALTTAAVALANTESRRQRCCNSLTNFSEGLLGRDWGAV